MMMPIRRFIYTIGCHGGLVSFMKETATTICGIQDAEWCVCDVPTDEMRGFCIILADSSYVPTVAQWTSDTEVLLITDKPDMTVLQQGFVDALTLPLDKERFAASFSNMVCRCDLKRRLNIRENQLETYYEISDDMLWTKDMADRHMDVNHILTDLVGKPREQIEGKHENEVYGLDPDDAGCKQSDFDVRTTGKMNFFEETMPGADGYLHHLRVTKAPWLDGQGRIIGTIGLAKDVSELMNQQNKFESFLNDLELGVVIADNAGVILQVNKVYLNVAGVTEEEAVGHNIKGIVRRKFEKSKEWGAKDYIITFQDGNKAVWTYNKFDLKDYWDNQYGYIYVFYDVTKERELGNRVMNMAMHDQLTGLPNRAGMFKHFSTLDHSGEATFLYIDIDNFKLVNDEFGHDVGDRLLIDVAGLFRDILADSLTARMGGDEFLSILEGSVELSEVKKKAEALLLEIKRIPDYPERILEITSFSIGILYRCPLEKGINNIIRMSDEGMYQAKRTGKNKYCIYHPV